MADRLSAPPRESKEFPVHAAGVHAAVLSDIIDMGDRWNKTYEKVDRKIRFIFRTAKVNANTNKPFEVSQEFTLSMGQKANLRKFVEAWVGPFKDDTAAWNAIPSLHKLEGRAGLLNIVHKTSGMGRVYANIASISPLPEGMSAPTLPPYERDPFWAKLQAQYAEEVRQHQPAPLGAGEEANEAAFAAAKEFGFEKVPDALADDDDDLPF